MRKVLSLIFAVTLLTACTATDTEVVDDGRLNVVATVGMVGDMVENVGGDHVNVQSIMGPGVDPHLYQPSAGDIALMGEADVIFYVGLHLEGKMVEVLESLGEEKIVVALSDAVDEGSLLSADPDSTYAHDPHIWFNVDLWSQAVPLVAETLSIADSENAESYAVSGESYAAQLVELDAWVEERVVELPEEQRVLITAHDAFEYFGDAYGFEVRGIQGISTASDYGLKDLEELIDFIVERQIKAVFIESSVSDKSIKSLQEGVNGEGWEIVIGGELFSDAMGDAGTVEGTYVGMVEHNVNTIVNALK